MTATLTAVDKIETGSGSVKAKFSTSTLSEKFFSRFKVEQCLYARVICFTEAFVLWHQTIFPFSHAKVYGLCRNWPELATMW
jgi:hypothetical protein